MKRGWARHAMERYELLKRWRELAGIVARACVEVLSHNCLKVYVVGGAAEDRLTVLSDIDVVMVVKDPKLKDLDTLIRVRRRAEELGLPVEAPVDVKALTEREVEELRIRGIYRRMIEVRG